MTTVIREISVLLLFGMICAPSALIAKDAFSVSVVVTGAEPRVGQVLVSLFNSSENYLESPLIMANADVDGDGNAFIALGDHPPGDYAVVAIYDKNGNGKLDTGIFRIPKEKIGYSNGAKGKFGPAKWNDARFSVTDSDVRVEIQLVNARGDR